MASGVILNVIVIAVFVGFWAAAVWLLHNRLERHSRTRVGHFREPDRDESVPAHHAA